MNEVILTEEEYQNILYELFFLECLRNAGVENWEGYDQACFDYEIYKDKEE